MRTYLHLTLTALLALLFFHPTASAQDDDDAEIRGTIHVERGADLASLAKISAAEARLAALKAFPGADIDEVELENEDGFLVYEVELTTNGEEMEVLIDAGDGSLLKSEREDDDDEGDDTMEHEDDDEDDGYDSSR